ncbi:unnamed protein product [Zymoseptoria tritici ST99CH_1A5]|uniref:F-box domain-containing protein n=1 Tax=Zymoseptoria tritici ST99CH_1A5 TaxID=1276529 RepID=A0A1Y6LIX7_ZYMTR|nr:unnamed protein product [Zymoseptoria tritici ST99CH_1A5]
MKSIQEWLSRRESSSNKPVISTHHIHTHRSPGIAPKKERASFLDLPSELRNRVYESALLVPYIITNYPPLPKHASNKPTLRSQDWEYHLSLTTCFALMRACKRVHRETLPIFYGINTFYLECISLVQDQPLRGPDFRAHEVRCEDDKQWRVRCHIRCKKARGLIRKIAIRTWDCEDLERRQMRALNLGQRVRSAGSRGGLGRYPKGWFQEDVEEEWKYLQNVETVSIFFGAKASRALKVPLMVEANWDLQALRSVMVPKEMYLRVVDAWKLYQTTLGAIGLLKRGIPGLKNQMLWCTELQAEVGGTQMAGKRIHGLCTNTPMLRKLFRFCDGLGFEESSLAVMKMPGRCLRCGSEWTKEHYSPVTPMKVCPGLGVTEEDFDQQEDVVWTRRLERGQTLLPFGSGPPEPRAEAVKAFGHYIERSEHNSRGYTMWVHNCPKDFNAGFTRLMYH